ncbi:MAG: two-component system sensor histidine kinase CreC, partial [Candidatus Tectomicrobia bacterium]
MSIRSRIFLGLFLVVGIGFAFLLNWITADLKPQYRASVEDSLVDTARVLAALAASTVLDGQVDVTAFRDAFTSVSSQPFAAQIYHFTKTSADFRVYITNAAGKVIFDSDFDPQRGRGRAEGEDYSQWRDVYLTLRGRYGARSSHEDPDKSTSSVMYVAAPIAVQGDIVGVLSVGKPTHNVNQFVKRAERKTLVAGAITGLAVIVVGFLISDRILRPIQRLTRYAQTVRDGARVTLPRLGRSEIRTLGGAFEEMRDALEGKQYVETYVQILTHEIKSPIAAIQGATELLKEDIPPIQRERFLDNILRETQRMQTVVDQLLLLSSLENRKAIQEVGDVDLAGMVQEVRLGLDTLLTAKQITFEHHTDNLPTFQGEPFLVRQAVANLLQNAVDFTPVGGAIVATVRQAEASIELEVQDNGPGIPAYAQHRIFERFYSLPRPDTGRKSSGLGLSLVQEIVLLHGGTVQLRNAAHGGTIAWIRFPMNSASTS